MKTSDLPEIYKRYSMILTDKREFSISGVEKEKIITTQETFVQLPGGDVINTTFIVSIAFDSEGTKNAFNKLSEVEKNKIASLISQKVS